MFNFFKTTPSSKKPEKEIDLIQDLNNKSQLIENNIKAIKNSSTEINELTIQYIAEYMIHSTHWYRFLDNIYIQTQAGTEIILSLNNSGYLFKTQEEDDHICRILSDKELLIITTALNYLNTKELEKQYQEKFNHKVIENKEINQLRLSAAQHPIQEALLDYNEIQHHYQQIKLIKHKHFNNLISIYDNK